LLGLAGPDFPETVTTNLMIRRQGNISLFTIDHFLNFQNGLARSALEVTTCYKTDKLLAQVPTGGPNPGNNPVTNGGNFFCCERMVIGSDCQPK
jgi:hypothetical protein